MNADAVMAQVRVALREWPKHPWIPGLAEPLAQFACHSMERDLGLTRDSYGTARLLLKNPSGTRLVVASCRPNTKGTVGPDGGEIPVEALHDPISRRIAGEDVRFIDSHSAIEGVTRRLEEALSLLNLVPTVWTTVHTLVRALHIIDQADDETDVSFSDPALPLSVFVSIPSRWSEVAALRVAEAILHEAMHLQLTLVESVMPLLLSQRKTYYSPWRDEERDSEGILQGLYAFSVIRSFLMKVPMSQITSASRNHISNRIAQIDSQIGEAQEFRESDELTSDGAAFVGWLLDMSAKCH